MTLFLPKYYYQPMKTRRERTLARFAVTLEDGERESFIKFDAVLWYQQNFIQMNDGGSADVSAPLRRNLLTNTTQHSLIVDAALVHRRRLSNFAAVLTGDNRCPPFGRKSFDRQTFVRRSASSKAPWPCHVADNRLVVNSLRLSTSHGSAKCFSTKWRLPDNNPWLV